MTTASLAECQANAIGPAPIGIAIHIVLELAQTLGAAHDRAEASGAAPHHGLSAARVILGQDGAVSLSDAVPSGSAPSSARAEAAYESPEQAGGGPLDRRSDVFSLGVVFWELLTGARLFARDSDNATRAAIVNHPILDVRSVNPEVPEAVAEVLEAALARDKQARFDNVAAFGRALIGARASGGISAANAGDVARWVAQRVPRLSDTPPALPAPSAPRLDAVPDLDMPSSSRARPIGVPAKPNTPPVAPTSVRSAAAAAFSDIALSISAQKSIAIGTGDEDDFDMQIERNISTSAAPAAMSSRPSGLHGEDRGSGVPQSRPSIPSRPGSGLELGAPQRLSARRERPVHDDEPGVFARVAGFVVALLVLGGAAFGLFKVVHRTGGRSVMSFLPHAFDGSSATESGAVALVTLVVAVTIIFVGVRLKPHVWTIVMAGGALLVLALAMVTVTLASTGENPTPPDGVLLVPYVAPVALLLLALGMGLRGGRMLGQARGARKLGGIPIAAIAGALAFAAFEISHLAGRL